LCQDDVPPILRLEDLITLQEQVTELPISDTLQRYLLALCQSARSLAGQDHAVSVRGALALQAAARAHALLDGQSAVHPDHLQAVFPHVLRHRLLTEDTLDPDPIIDAALNQTPVP
ncbi:MAG: AAA family ATPase, partial [Verrucomicrobiota bacterium]|nr:AAA family ATPase [Verrucomicrobiota bacterium]